MEGRTLVNDHDNDNGKGLLAGKAGGIYFSVILDVNTLSTRLFPSLLLKDLSICMKVFMNWPLIIRDFCFL